MIDIYVIGCGGVGGYLLNLLPQTMACLAVDLSIASGIPNQEIMGKEGISSKLLNPFRSLTLVDGDEFSGHNALRQAGVTGSKVRTQLLKLRHSDIFTTWLTDTQLKGYNTYLTPANMRSIMPIPEGDPCEYDPGRWGYSLLKNQYFVVIFPCVDNHKTRYEVAKWAERFNNVLLVNGGNEKTTGNVIVYERRGSVPLDPPIYEVYPDVAAGRDKRPDETACTDVAAENDQTAITNNLIASFMLAMFSKWIKEGKLDQQTTERDQNGKFITRRTNEVIIDTERMSVRPLSRKAKNTSTKVN